MGIFVKLIEEDIYRLSIKKEQLQYGLIDFDRLQQIVEVYNRKNPSRKYYLHQNIKPEQFHYDLDLKKLEHDAYEDPPEIKLEKQLREKRIAERQYQDLIKNITGQKVNPLTGTKQGVREIEKSTSFGISFIFSFFLSGLAGYYVGKYYLQYSDQESMIVAIFFLMASLIIETSLFIIKIVKDDQKVAYLKKEEQKKKNTRLNQNVQQQEDNFSETTSVSSEKEHFKTD